MGSLIHYCEVCGKQFVPYRKFHKRCSSKCRLIATEKKSYYRPRKTVIKACKNCGNEFETNNKKKVFCCVHCQELHVYNSYIKQKPTERICKHCGKTFESTHVSKSYCREDCYCLAKKERQRVKQ